MEIGAITWNIFSGRDLPPNPALFTWRSRLVGTTERNATHVQVNRDLFDEFARVLSGARWDVALLQECPPSWAPRLAAASGATPHLSLTARNWLGWIRRALARRNPDLLGSWGGGSNLILTRGQLQGGGARRRELMLRRVPERRKMVFVQLPGGIAVANLHASARAALAEADVRMAAEAAVEWSGGGPLILGGDLNLRPDETDVFEELGERFGLRAPTGPRSIDHLLARGLEIVGPAAPWPPEAREVRYEGLALRLSDHAPVEARFRMPGPQAV